MPKLREVIGGDQNKDLLSRNYMSMMRPCSATDVKVDPTKVGIQAKPLKYSEKKLYFVLI